MLLGQTYKVFRRGGWMVFKLVFVTLNYYPDNIGIAKHQQSFICSGIFDAALHILHKWTICAYEKVNLRISRRRLVHVQHNELSSDFRSFVIEESRKFEKSSSNAIGRGRVVTWVEVTDRSTAASRIQSAVMLML